MASGTTPDGQNWFAFRIAPYGDETRIEWPQGAPLALFDNTTAVTMIHNGYGTIPSEDLINEYNTLAASAPATPVAPDFPPEGWLAHPSAPGFYYKDQEVLSEADLRLKVK